MIIGMAIPNPKVVLAVKPEDLRICIQGRCALAAQRLKEAPENRAFCWPRGTDAKREKVRMKPEAPGLLQDGEDLRGARLRACEPVL